MAVTAADMTTAQVVEVVSPTLGLYGQFVVRGTSGADYLLSRVGESSTQQERVPLSQISAVLASNPVSSAGTTTPAAYGVMSAWYRALATNPANCYLLLLGDSTSYEPNDSPLYSRLRTFHTTKGSGLDGMTADTNHIVSGGNNGYTLTAWWAQAGAGTHSYVDGSGVFTYADVKALYATAEAAPGKLCIVFSFGINDLRLNVDRIGVTGASYVAFVALMNTVLSQMRVDMPNVTIVLRVADPITTDDVSGLHYVQNSVGGINPAGGAQALIDALRTSYLSFRDVWPNVVIWNGQDRIFGRTAIASTQTNLASTQIHPSASGYQLVADFLIKDLVGLPPTYPSPGQAGTTTTGIISTTSTPWTVDPRSVEDTRHFQLIAQGEFVSSGTNFLRFGPDSDHPLLPGQLQINDVVEFLAQSSQIPSGVAFTAIASGGQLANVQIGSWPGNLPAAWQSLASPQGVVRVWREVDQGDFQLAAVRAQILAATQGNPGANRYVRVGRIASGSTNFAIISGEPQAAGSMTSGQWPITRADSLYVAGVASPVAMTNYSFLLSGANLQLSGTTRDFTNDVGKIVILVGAHAAESTGDRLDHVSVAAGTVAANAATDVVVTYTGAQFERPFGGVHVTAEAALPAGIMISAQVTALNQVTVRVANVTTGAVVVGTIFVVLWLLR